MSFITNNDFKKDFINFFHTIENFDSFIEDINSFLENINNDNIKKFNINQIKSISTNEYISNKDYINEMQGIYKTLDSYNSLIENGFSLEQGKENYDIEFLGLPKKLNSEVFSNPDFDITKVSNNSQETLSKYENKLDINIIDSKRLLNDDYILNFLLSNTELFETKKSILTQSHFIKKNDKTFLLDIYNNKNMSFGSNISHFNQLLKFQKAKTNGIVDEVILKFEGNLTEEFLNFINPIDLKDNTELSHVNILYDVVLPSGKLFTFILKSGISSKKEIEEFTATLNEETYNSQDTEVINRIIDAGLSTNGLNKFLSEFKVEEEDKSFEEYNDIFNDTYNKFYQEICSIGLKNSGDTKMFQEDISREEVYKMLDKFQSILNSAESTQVQKEIYLIDNTEYEKIIDKMISMMKQIKSSSPEYDYIMKNDLYVLDPTHIMLDAIQSYKGDIDSSKKGRNYKRIDKNGNDRFLTAETLNESIQNDKLETEYNVFFFDGKKTLSEKGIDIDRLNQIKNKVLKNSFHEIKEIFFNKQGLKNEIEIETLLKDSFGLKNTSSINSFIQEFISFEKSINNYNSLFKEEMSLFNQSDNKNSEDRKKIIDKKTNLTNDKIVEIIEAFKSSFPNCIDSISHFKEIDMSNQKKYIYTISVNEKGEEEVYAYLEGFDPSVFGRPSHSELSEGRPVVTAGEFIVEKENKKFSSIKEFNEYIPNIEYEMTEMNNGSGHYRPNAKSLLRGEEIMNKNGIYPKNIKNSLDRRWTIHYPSFGLGKSKKEQNSNIENKNIVKKTNKKVNISPI